MKKLLLFILPIFFISCQSKPSIQLVEENDKTKPNPCIVIHGGAGSITRERMPDSLVLEYEKSLETALDLGYTILDNGGSALMAVETAIIYLENNPLFNAGKGSVLNAIGEVENDASIMDGSTLKAGAIAGIQNVKNPITLARLVKDSTSHVMLSGTGAFEFAKEMSVDLVNQEYFLTPRRKKQLEEIRDRKNGTVGCVALDKNGNIAAGTSTGGMSMKKYGRIGDSPIIGAGTYAHSNVAGVSCTGHGEYFIKNAVAYDVIALIDYKGLSLKEASEQIIQKKLVEQNASGGLIAIDKDGNISMEFNTDGMFRGTKSPDTTYVGLFKNQ